MQNDIEGQSYTTFIDIVKEKLDYGNLHNFTCFLQDLEWYRKDHQKRDEPSRFMYAKLIEKANAYDKIKELLGIV